MLPLDIATTEVVDLSTLKTGQFFFHESNGTFDLGVSLASDGKNFPWLSLSGASAFVLNSVRSGQRKLVLALGFDLSAVRLRIAEGITPVKYVDHTIGQMVFDRESGPSIAVRWTNHEAGDHQTTVALRSWQATSLCDARDGALNNWTLSFLDESGSWVDLVSR